MMLRKTPSLQQLLLVFLFIGIDADAAISPNRQFHIDYTVEVSNRETNLFHVTAVVKNIRQARLDLSLPAWGPGFYTMRNYAKHMLRFKITDAKGVPVPYTRVRKQTWSIDTRKLNQVTVEFDYRADTLAGALDVPQLNEATIAKDFAYFTGVQLFLMAEGHRMRPSNVNFIFPAEWRMISALKETSNPTTFTAPDYDTLADAPTLMGHFDVTRFEVEGKPHYFAATPAGAFSNENAKKLTDVLGKVAVSESAMFGGLPYEKYVYFYFILPPGEMISEGGALEHLNSSTAFVPAGDFSMEPVAWTAAHEFFHLWNVKRIRPVEMWPYDYQRENETPLLWVCEGFSNYYAIRTLYRLGLNSEQRFLDRIARAITSVETSAARAYISPAEASVSDVLPGKVFGTDYYMQGQNLGALLDLSIRHDTQGKSSLDDVMRGLYREFYQRGKGFSTEDMIRIINRITERDYHDFFRRYVWGIEVPNYDTIFGYAGYRVEKTTQKRPSAGFSFERGGRVTIVPPGSSAAEAGLLVGDVITAIDGEELNKSSLGIERIGKTIKWTIKRAGEERDIMLKLGSRELDGREVYRIVELSRPTADQLKIREGWLSVSSQSHPGPTDQQVKARVIVDKATRAMGGKAKLAKLKAMTWRSKGTYQFKGVASSFTGQWAIQGPNHYRKIREWAENGQAYKTTLVENGNKSWFRDRRMNLTTFPQREPGGVSAENFLHWTSLRLDLTDKALTLSPLGKSRVDGREVQGIKVTHRELHEVEFELYFDGKTGLLAKLVTQSRNKDTPPEERIFSEYKETGGIKYASKLKWMTRYGDDMAVQEEQRSEMKLHDKLDASVFDQP